MRIAHYVPLFIFYLLFNQIMAQEYIPAIYHTNGGSVIAPFIQRAELDGANPQVIVDNTLVSQPFGITIDTLSGKMYWTDFTNYGQSQSFILRSDLDGTNVDTVVSGINDVRGLTLDLVSGKIYWCEISGNARINRSDLNGQNIDTILISTAIVPRFLDIDHQENKLYFTDSPGGVIYRSNLDGSTLESLLTNRSGAADIVVDQEHRKMYWAEASTQTIQRANLDGSDIEGIITQNLDYPYGISIDVIDKKLYWTDLISAGGGTAANIKRSDLDGNNIEEVITTGLYEPFDIEVYHVNEPISDIGYAQWDIADKFNVSQNYPNPFNPSTTIKYSLTQSAHVEIRIFNAAGKELQTLENRQHSKGSYQLIWDGSDFASGVYIVQVKTENVVQSKKMLLIK